MGYYDNCLIIEICAKRLKKRGRGGGLLCEMLLLDFHLSIYRGGFPELASGWGLTSRGLTNCYRITITGSWGRLLIYTTTENFQGVYEFECYYRFYIELYVC